LVGTETVERVEYREEAILGAGLLGDCGVPDGPPPLHAPRQVGRDQLVFASEVRVQGRRGDAGLDEYRVHRGPPDTVPVEESFRGIEQPLAHWLSPHCLTHSNTVTYVMVKRSL